MASLTLGLVVFTKEWNSWAFLTYNKTNISFRFACSDDLLVSNHEPRLCHFNDLGRENTGFGRFKIHMHDNSLNPHIAG